MFFHFPNEIHDKCQHVQTWCMSKQNKSMSYRKFGLFICCISDISCWDPLKSCGIFPWWDTILELGLKFIMPYQKWLWGGSDTQGMIGYITAGCGCWTNAPITMREKCPNTELFLVRIFLYSDWIRRDTLHLSVFSPNTGKSGPEITPHLDTCMNLIGFAVSLQLK